MKSSRFLAFGVSWVLSGACSLSQAENVIAWRSVPGTTQPSQEDRLHASFLARESITLLGQNDLTHAEATLREALALMPDKAVYHFNLACILTARGQVEGALSELESATDCGFTDFTLLETLSALKPLHETARYQQLVARKDDIKHKAAERALKDLKQQFGKDYLYEVDEDHKLIFATNTDQATLNALRTWLQEQAKAQEQELFSHPPDEFIRIVVPSQAEYRKLMRLRNVMGIYEDESRTLLAERLGQVMTHEFTHALHAADQRACGQEHPVWLREGLASMYEAGEFVDGKLVPRDNFRLGVVQSAVRRNALISFDRLLSLSIQDFVRSPNLAYGETSSLLLYLREKNLLRKFYDGYKLSYVNDPTGREALQTVTAMGLSDLQAKWSEWVLTRKPPMLLTTPGGPYLGVHFGDATDGLKVAMVLPGSAAGKAGIRGGDVIVGFESHEVRDYASLAPLLAEHKPGDTVTFKLRRDGKYLDVPVELGKR